MVLCENYMPLPDTGGGFYLTVLVKGNRFSPDRNQIPQYRFLRKSSFFLEITRQGE